MTDNTTFCLVMTAVMYGFLLAGLITWILFELAESEIIERSIDRIKTIRQKRIDRNRLDSVQGFYLLYGCFDQWDESNKY